MGDHPLSRIAVGETDGAHATLISAYRHDPVHRWLYPDDDGFARRFRSSSMPLRGVRSR